MPPSECTTGLAIVSACVIRFAGTLNEQRKDGPILHTLTRSSYQGQGEAKIITLLEEVPLTARVPRSGDAEITVPCAENREPSEVLF